MNKGYLMSKGYLEVKQWTCDNPTFQPYNTKMENSQTENVSYKH